ncbi:MAG: methylmalonyl Co-A mutase-associated GTPase MeaB [Candidatus Neomarinimicrobiota bacterium]
MNSDILNDLRKNDLRTVSRLISRLENETGDLDDILSLIFPYAQEAIRVGFTGPPGAGKSTLIDGIIRLMRKDSKSVGVVTVDPTSPFSGGALLGDRLRMDRHALDKKVYIRSMGTRGRTGGLARMSRHVGEILACTGKDYILFETVGIGQVELEVIESVDVTIVMFVPESGDEIQFMKAGPIEVGDIFVVNKADRKGARIVARTLEEYVGESFQERQFIPKTLLSVATTGEGVEDVYGEIVGLVEKLKKLGTFSSRRRKQYSARVRNEVREELTRRFLGEVRENDLNRRIEQFRKNNVSPYEAARDLMASLA